MLSCFWIHFSIWSTSQMRWLDVTWTRCQVSEYLGRRRDNRHRLWNLIVFHTGFVPPAEDKSLCLRPSERKAKMHVGISFWMCLETSLISSARWICLQLSGRQQSFKRTPKWEGLNSKRLALGCSTEQSLKKRQKAGQRGKKRNEQCRTSGETRAGGVFWFC